MAANYLVAM